MITMTCSFNTERRLLLLYKNNNLYIIFLNQYNINKDNLSVYLKLGSDGVKLKVDKLKFVMQNVKLSDSLIVQIYIRNQTK